MVPGSLLYLIGSVAQPQTLSLYQLGSVRVSSVHSSKTVVAKELPTNMHLEGGCIAFTCQILSKNYNTVPEI